MMKSKIAISILTLTVGILATLTSFPAAGQTPNPSADETANERQARMRRILNEVMSSRDAEGNVVLPSSTNAASSELPNLPAVPEEPRTAPPETNAAAAGELPALPTLPAEQGPATGAEGAQPAAALPELPSIPAAPGAAEPAAATTPEPVASAETSEPAAEGGETSESKSEMTPAPIITPGEDPDEIVSVNSPHMPFDQALDFYADLTGRILLRQAIVPNAPSEVYMVFEDLTKAEAIEAYNAVFAMNNIALLPVGDKFLKVVPTNQAGQEGQPFDQRKASLMAETGQFVRKFVQIEHADVTEVAQILSPFASVQAGNSAVTAVESNQVLILQDYAANVKRMMEIINKVDIEVPVDVELELIPIKYALATDIGQVIGSLTPNGAVIPVSTGSRSIRSLGGRGGGIGGVGGRSGVGGSSLNSGYGGYGGYGTDRRVQQSSVRTIGSTASSRQSSFQSRLRNIVNRAAAGEIQVLGDAKIIPDERSNSILVFANKRDMQMIKEIIEKLDVVQAQVLIETVIMEVTLGDSLDFGVSYLQRKQEWGDVSTTGWINNTSGSNPFGPFPDPDGGGSFSGGFTYLANINDDLNVVVSAIAEDRETHILQRPRIQTFHAEPAYLFVGRNEPFVTSRIFGGSFTSNSSNITRERIGISLEVLPLINPEGLVVLEINQQIEDVVGTRSIPELGDVPITSNREASASVAVRDGDTIILGGIIQNKTSNTKTGVPFLKDIPLLGALFRKSSKSEDRTELVILLRPTVLKTPEIAQQEAQKELNDLVGVRHAEMQILQQQRRREERLNQELQRYQRNPDNRSRKLK